MFNRAPEPFDPMLVTNAYAQGIFPHLAMSGVKEIPRKAYERRLKEALRLRCTWDR